MRVESCSKSADWEASAPDGGDIAEAVRLLRRSQLGRGLGVAQIRELAGYVQWRHVRSGETLYRQDEPSGSLFFVVRGRVKLTVSRGSYHFHDYLGRGDHFGELAMLTRGAAFGTAVALIDCELLELSAQRFDELLGRLPAFAANLSRALGMRLRWATSGRKRSHRPSVVALVNSTIRTQKLLAPLARTLCEAGESLEILTDRRELWPAEGAYLIERLPQELPSDRRLSFVGQRLARALDHGGRVLLDLTQRTIADELRGLAGSCEEIWWLVEPEHRETAAENLRRFLSERPDLAERIRWVWILAETEKVAPRLPEGLEGTARDFKVTLTDEPRSASWPQRRSILRLARHLRGLRVALALSGGGARGMAHLGVLRAMERAELGFDFVAGTSSGALVGLSYAASWNPDDALREFHRALTPSRPWRLLPGGGRRWFMYSMFRLGAWERLLRPYLPEGAIEQLAVPLATVAVDLVSGKQVVRERGDAIHAVLESINLPIISRPILRDGMALVDGGVLNNLPADVAIDRGADLVVGVDVMARLPQSFAGNLPGMPTEAMRRPGTLETLVRFNEVQDLGVGQHAASRVDVMITPETAHFDFADFSRATELADVGQHAAEEVIPQLRRMLADLERE